VLNSPVDCLDPASLVYLVLRDIDMHGLSTGWYEDDDSPRRDLLGYAKQHLGYPPDAKERAIEPLYEFARFLGFEPSFDGLIGIVRMNDEHGQMFVRAKLHERLKRATQ